MLLMPIAKIFVDVSSTLFSCVLISLAGFFAIGFSKLRIYCGKISLSFFFFVFILSGSLLWTNSLDYGVYKILFLFAYPLPVVFLTPNILKTGDDLAQAVNLLLVVLLIYCSVFLFQYVLGLGNIKGQRYGSFFDVIFAGRVFGMLMLCAFLKTLYTKATKRMFWYLVLVIAAFFCIGFRNADNIAKRFVNFLVGFFVF